MAGEIGILGLEEPFGPVELAALKRKVEDEAASMVRPEAWDGELPEVLAERVADEAAGIVQADVEVLDDGGEAEPDDDFHETPFYHPMSPFRLKFDFVREETSGGVAWRWGERPQMGDPVFIWQYVDGRGRYHADSIQAFIAELSSHGTVYLNLYLARNMEGVLTGGLVNAIVAMVEDERADASVRLYDLRDDGKVVDYRHAMLTLGMPCVCVCDCDSSSSSESGPGSESGSSGTPCNPCFFRVMFCHDGDLETSYRFVYEITDFFRDAMLAWYEGVGKTVVLPPDAVRELMRGALDEIAAKHQVYWGTDDRVVVFRSCTVQSRKWTFMDPWEFVQAYIADRQGFMGDITDEISVDEWGLFNEGGVSGTPCLIEAPPIGTVACATLELPACLLNCCDFESSSGSSSGSSSSGDSAYMPGLIVELFVSELTPGMQPFQILMRYPLRNPEQGVDLMAGDKGLVVLPVDPDFFYGGGWPGALYHDPMVIPVAFEHNVFDLSVEDDLDSGGEVQLKGGRFMAVDLMGVFQALFDTYPLPGYEHTARWDVFLGDILDTSSTAHGNGFNVSIRIRTADGSPLVDPSAVSLESVHSLFEPAWAQSGLVSYRISPGQGLDGSMERDPSKWLVAMTYSVPDASTVVLTYSGDFCFDGGWAPAGHYTASPRWMLIPVRVPKDGAHFDGVAQWNDGETST